MPPNIVSVEQCLVIMRGRKIQHILHVDTAFYGVLYVLYTNLMIALLLTWFNFDRDTDKKNHMPTIVWDNITYQFPNFIGWPVEVWEWMSNFIPYVLMDVIPSPSWGYN